MHAPSQDDQPGASSSAAASRFRSLSDPESLRELAWNLREGIYISDESGQVLDANPAMLKLMGVETLEELQEYSAHKPIVDPARRAEELDLLQRDGFVREFELELLRADGQRLTVMDTMYVVVDPETGERFHHGVLVDISSRKELEEQLRELCVRDPLTGAYNRRYLDDMIRR